MEFIVVFVTSMFAMFSIGVDSNSYHKMIGFNKTEKKFMQNINNDTVYYCRDLGRKRKKAKKDLQNKKNDWQMLYL